MHDNQLIPADKARHIMLDGLSALPVEQVELRAAGGRVLGEDLVSLRTQPPFDASAMDGFAVRSADLASVPCELKIVGESRAGSFFPGVLAGGQAVRIFTGAVVPEGADTIVIQENTEFDSGVVKILVRADPGKFIRPAGLDFTTGQTLLKRGDILDPSRLALAAAMNHPTVPVIRKPLVSLLATGDELVEPGREPKAGQIVASNMFGLLEAARQAGADTFDQGIIADQEDALVTAFENALAAGSDLIITTGGASVGDHDLVYPVAKQFGFEFSITKVAMRPGKPFLFGRLHRRGKTVALLGLAGNPVSSLVAFKVFCRPFVGRLAGLPDERVLPVAGKLGMPLPANDEREEYMRANKQKLPDGSYTIMPMDKQDSSMLVNLTRADCFLIRPANAPAAKTGDRCQYIPA